MKVFISWSGEIGCKVGQELRDWLPSVLQAVKPYFSPEDIAKGTKWATEISTELEQCGFGIVILDRIALNSNWVHFEAGALAKNIGKSKVIPILVGIEPAEITGPLVHFQSSKLDEADSRKLIKSINDDLGDRKLEQTVLNKVFDNWFPNLLESYQKIINEHKESNGESSPRSDRDILEEILQISRMTSRNVSRELPPGAIDDLVNAVDKINNLIEVYGTEPELIEAAHNLIRPVRYIIKTGRAPMIDRYGSIIRNLDQKLNSFNNPSKGGE